MSWPSRRHHPQVSPPSDTSHMCPHLAPINPFARWTSMVASARRIIYTRTHIVSVDLQLTHPPVRPRHQPAAAENNAGCPRTRCHTCALLADGGSECPSIPCRRRHIMNASHRLRRGLTRQPKAPASAIASDAQLPPPLPLPSRTRSWDAPPPNHELMCRHRAMSFVQRLEFTGFAIVFRLSFFVFCPVAVSKNGCVVGPR